MFGVSTTERGFRSKLGICIETHLCCILMIRHECEVENYRLLAGVLANITVEELQQRKASWHLSCYKRCTHKGNLNRLQVRYKNQVAERQNPGTSIKSGQEIPTRDRKVVIYKRMPASSVYIINLKLYETLCTLFPPKL